MRIFILTAVFFQFFSCAGQTQIIDKKRAQKKDGPYLALIRRHSERDTKMDGSRCRFYPSCSYWSNQAYKENRLTGILLTIDRLLFREHRALYKYYSIAPPDLSEDVRYFDPLKDSYPVLEKEKTSLYRPWMTAKPAEYKK